MTSPTPARVDELAKEYNKAKEEWLQAKLAATDKQVTLDRKKDELITLIRDQGSGHAQKSWILHGVQFEVMATLGQTVVTDSTAVEQFREASQQELKPKQFRQIFEAVVTYRLLSTAAEFVRTSKLSRKLTDLFARCQMIKDKAPTLTVREKTKAATA